ncbi:MAG TPA: alanine--tRNA ligase [Candidatus Binataceae bacterium]|nr:alanine--tRNA ligase [Candidatus Binataceae bacterium]
MHWTTARIRQSFLDFFRERDHAIVPSASLVPKGDPTLLFTNAGMVPFKDYFLGVRTAPYKRVADCQKCLRISGKHNDLEAVGRDTYHHTFFEMLGNWSFGDYYKHEAIQWHWELVNGVWGIDASRLWATVYKDDNEAEQAWLDFKFLPRERVLRFGEKDNFWEMGETGPCGPCSEIHIDRGVEACDGKPHLGQACAVNVDGCSRFIELGNLVFIQYNRDNSGALTPLPMKHVDTGTGLDRVASVLQTFERKSPRPLGNYDTDLFQTIIRKIEEAARKFGAEERYGKSETIDISFRAIADHARTIAFLAAEGIFPGNSDREYVMRRIVRRAARHGRYLGIHRPFLAMAVEGVNESMGDAYPELREHAKRTADVVGQEEERFGETLDRGLELIDAERKRLKDSGKHTLAGEVAFKLYDTYGFPLDLTEDVLRSDAIDVDTAGFERLMEEQRERARAARKDSSLGPELILGAELKSRFVGYRATEGASEILAVSATGGNSIAIVVAETPFYPEGGGQVGDRGVIESGSGSILEITDTRKADGAIVHVGRILHGDARDFAKGAHVRLKVDAARREATMLNHSATHILHYALRDILGTHVHQAGSLVEPAHLRFDFHHTGKISESDLRTIEDEVNARIRENAPVTTEEMAYDDAIKAGALAFFGDKYGDRVRVVKMGDFSVELCGGTHVDNTGRIGLLKLDSESGIAAGVRRVEAMTGRGALDAIREREKILGEIASHLGARDTQAIERLEKLLAREKELEKKLRQLEQKLASGGGGSAETVSDAGGVKIVTLAVEGVEAPALREIADRLRQKYKSCVVAIGSSIDSEKAALVVAVTPDLTARVKAGDIVKRIAPIIGGSGGGRPDFAQAGGKEPSKLGQALDRVRTVIS